MGRQKSVLVYNAAVVLFSSHPLTMTKFNEESHLPLKIVNDEL